jgi:hypothetical protein
LSHVRPLAWNVPRAVRLLSLVVMVSALPPNARAAEPPTEHQVKAAFIYNFARFIEWPPDARKDDDTFVVSVLGRDPIAEVIVDTLRAKKIDGKTVVVRRIVRPEEVGSSQIVFICDSEQSRLSSILKGLEAAPVLTVGETDQFAERGGVIRFRVDRDQVRFDINVTAAERARLKISSELLKLARIVAPNKGG